MPTSRHLHSTPNLRAESRLRSVMRAAAVSAERPESASCPQRKNTRDLASLSAGAASKLLRCMNAVCL